VDDRFEPNEGVIMAATAELGTFELATPTTGEPRDEAFYESIDGRWIETPTMSVFASIVASRLTNYLMIHIEPQSPCPGQVVFETLFRIPLANDASRQCRPDIAFVSADRWPIDRPASLRENAWDVIPDLAVEVVSPTDIADDLLGKVKEYFQAGVRLVWVVYPIQRCIHVYDAWNRIRVVTGADELDGGEVLPGFRRSLDRLFGPVAPDNGKPA
jgi:Uma2 family endonuclease